MEEGGVYMDGGIVTDGRELNRNRQAGRQTDRQTDIPLDLDTGMKRALLYNNTYVW